MAENEYDSVVSEIASETSGRLKQNNFANQDSNPDEEAKALSYADKFGTSRDVVKQDIKAFEAKELDNEYSDVVKTLPKTTEFLSNIDNHAVAKDDYKSLGFFEKTGTSFLERASVNLTDTVLEAGEAVLDRFAYGSLEAAQGVSKFIRMRQDKSRFDLENDLKQDPTNPSAKLMLDYINKSGSIGGESLKGFDSKLEKEKEQFRSEQAEKSIFEQLAVRDYSGASKTTLLQGLQSTPQLVALMLNPALGTTSLFASSSGSKYDENIKAGLPVDQATSNALVTGSIETGTELVFGLGTSNPFKQTIKNAEKMLGKQTALSLVKGVASDLLKNSGEEGVEEVLSNTTSSLYDWATDANPQALDGLLGKNIDAFFGGFGGGFVAGGGGAIYSYKAATKRVSDKLRASAVVETMDQFGKAALESKTLKRSPEKFQQFVDGQAAGTAMEKVYISPESANEYFQSKGIDPTKGFQDLGMLPEYEKAMQTGADITLPLGKYITNSINTEHYDGLKNDVKFNPNDFTQKQIKQQEKELRDEVNQVKEKYDKWEKEGSAIVSDIYDQVKASGESHETAKAHAVLWEAIGTMAVRENRSPKELYNQFGFKIIGPKTKADPFALPDEEINPVGGAEYFQAWQSLEKHNEFVNSEEFKNWYDGSVASWEDGSPKRFYHGTTTTFKNFNPDKSLPKGIYGFFTNEENFATEFANGEQGNIVPAYISIKNVFDGAKNSNVAMEYFDKNGSKEYSSRNNYEQAIKRREWLVLEEPGFVEFLKEKGYDSFYTREKGNDNYAVLQPGKIRSSITNEFMQDNQGSYNPRTKVIKALESKNETTLLHEYGHAFLDVFQHLATSATASEAIKKDFEGLLKFLEVESASDIKTTQHEKFARYFEGYLMEGKSPSNSKAMIKAFNSFKLWMIKNYQNVDGLSDAAFEQQKNYLIKQGKDVSNLKREDFAIKMNDDIRGFMNRMIVAEDQIQSATENLGINHLFKDPIGMGMNEEQALKYKEAIEEANAYAEAELTKKLVDDLHKKQKQDYKEKFQNKFHEIKKQLMENPIYNALETLKTGKDNMGRVIEDPIKLNKESLVRNFGKEVANLLPRSVFSENGLHYQEAAEAFGFDNAVDFITDMTRAEDINTVAKREAEASLQKEYPDLFNDPKITDEANMAVHNEKRSKVLQLELQFLEENYKPLLKDAIRRITGRSSLNQQIREAARQNLEKQSVGSIKPHEYSAAERKYSREAGKALAAGDIKKAYEYKRMEYLNHEYYRQAVEAVAFVEKNVAKYSKVFKGNADVAKTRDLDYVNTARAVLGLYGIVSTNNESPLKYLQKTAMYDKEKFGSIQSLLADAIEGAGNYNQVSYNQFLDMINTVDALWDMSREMKTIEIEGKKVELTDALSDLSNLFNSWNENKKDVTITGSVSDKEKSSVNYLGFGASLKVVGTYIDFIDNNMPDGPFKKYVWYPVVKASAKYRVEASKINKQLNDIVVKYDKIFKDDKIYTADELSMTDDNGRNVNFSFKKSDIIMMILHSGNKSNKSKLVRGGRIYEGKQYAWGHLNDDGSLNSVNFDRQFAKWRADGTLSKADYDFAQEIWWMLKGMKPDLQKAHKKTEGFYFNEVTADEFTNEFGTYEGGYIPAKVDVYTDEKAALRQEKDHAENLNNSYAFPTVSKGSTMSRVEAFAAPLSLEFNLLAGHVDWAVKYTYLNPAIKNANKIVLNDGFRESLKQVDPVACSEMLVPWLTRAAEQRSIVPSQGDMKTLDAGFKLLRQRFSLQVLALSVANMLQNFGSTIIASSKTPAKHIMAASVELLKNRTKTLEFIQDSSDFMKSEMDGSAQRALQQGLDIITQTGKYAKLQDLGQQAAGFLDNTTTVFVKQQIWLAEYNNLVESGMRHEQAANGADDLTRKITSVLNPEDVSRVMTGSQTKAFFTQFAGYFNRILNYRYYGVRSIQKELGLGTREGMTRLVPFVLSSAVLPAMYAAIVSKTLAGKLTEDEDKDGKFWDDLMMSLFGTALFKETVAGVPYVGQAANYAMNKYNNNPVDDKLSLAPSAALFELGVSLPAKIIRDASKEELKKQTVKDALTVAGAISGLPVGWFGKPIGYQMDVNDRKAKPTGPIDYTRGLVTGQPGKK